jgi:hypothetical protein
LETLAKTEEFDINICNFLKGFGLGISPSQLKK